MKNILRGAPIRIYFQSKGKDMAKKKAKKKAKRKKNKRVENCLKCGKVMNLRRLIDGRTVWKHSCVSNGKKYSVLVYVSDVK